MFNNRFTKKKSKKKLWTVEELAPPKPPGYFENVVPCYDEKRFQKKFRISKKTFDFLCDELNEIMKKEDTRFREAVPVAKRILIAISILKSNCDLGTIADLFMVGKTTVHEIVLEFCDAISIRLFKALINFPSTERERKQLANSFESKWAFPGVIGALDGCHIPIKKPVTDGEDYFNYKKFYSINLLGLVDDKYCFR